MLIFFKDKTYVFNVSDVFFLNTVLSMGANRARIADQFLNADEADFFVIRKKSIWSNPLILLVAM